MGTQEPMQTWFDNFRFAPRRVGNRITHANARTGQKQGFAFVFVATDDDSRLAQVFANEQSARARVRSHLARDLETLRADMNVRVQIRQADLPLEQSPARFARLAFAERTLALCVDGPAPCHRTADAIHADGDVWSSRDWLAGVSAEGTHHGHCPRAATAAPDWLSRIFCAETIASVNQKLAGKHR